MAQQFGRKVSLTVGDDAGNGLDLSDLQIKFETHIGDFQTPNWATIRVYNLSESTTKTLQTTEYSKVTLAAGYEGNFGVIFQGTIKYKFRGHESNVDSYLDIIAADGDVAYNNAILNIPLAAGSNAAQQLAVITNAMQPFGATAAPYQPPLSSTKLPRGKVMFGPARDFMRILANTNGATWSIQRGSVQLNLQSSYLPGDAVVLTWATGLVGFPEQTLNGLIVRCLLNPEIAIGGRIQIDNSQVQQFQFDVNFIQAQMQQQFLDLMKLDDGTYKVLLAEHSGDTRGNNWYTKLTCIGINGSIPPNSPLISQLGVLPYGS